MGFGHQKDVYFLGVDKYVYFFYALDQAVYIPHRYVVYMNYVTNLLSNGDEEINERAHLFSLFGMIVSDL
jgi:hypothetical protein